MPKGNPADILSPQSYWGGRYRKPKPSQETLDTLPRGSGSSYGLKAVHHLKTVFPALQVFPPFLELFALKLYFPRFHFILPQITTDASRDTAVTITFVLALKVRISHHSPHYRICSNSFSP